MAKLSDKARAAGKANLDKGRLLIDERSPAEALEIRRKGQAAQQAAAKRRRALKEIMQDLLAMDCTPDLLDGAGEAAKSAAESLGRPLTVYEAISMAQVAQAAQGSTQAFVAVRDSAGDKPTDKQEITGVLTDGDKALMEQMQAKFGKMTDDNGGKTVK